RDSIDHGPGGHDDVVNAAAGALVLAASVGAREPLRLLFLEPMTEEENQARKQAAHQQIVEAVQRQGFWWPGE
ncbi:MAG: hypothetical protein ACE5MG_11165, partial [Candidatus Methylomirabilales bacterium]